MFDSDLNLYLQSFQNRWLTGGMLAISALGSEVFLTIAAGMILLGINFRKGVLFTQILLWSFLLTLFFKHVFDLPRPFEVNSSVLVLYPEFVLRFVNISNPGLPSGHMCSTTVFWLAVWRLFPRKAVTVIAISLMILMPLSRMYLGLHFLGDVVGGFILGILILLLAIFLHRSFHFSQDQDERLYRYSIPVTLYLFVLPVLMNAIQWFDPRLCAKFLGTNVGIYWSLASGFPQEKRGFKAGVLRFLIAALIYASVRYMLIIFDPCDGGRVCELLIFALPPAVSIIATLEVSKRLRLYER